MSWPLAYVATSAFGLFRDLLRLAATARANPLCQHRHRAESAPNDHGVVFEDRPAASGESFPIERQSPHPANLAADNVCPSMPVKFWCVRPAIATKHV